jgi:uncharacterized iron-regulated protein
MVSGTEVSGHHDKGARGRLCFLARGFLMAALAGLAGCASLRGGYEADSLQHPLNGRIWDMRAQAFVSEAEVADRLAGTDFILLGEIHDNPEHHRVQSWLLQSLVTRGRRPAVAFEPFDRERQAAIDAARRDAATLERIEQAARPEKGWQWDWYASLVQTALDLHLPILALNLSRAEARRVAAESFAVLGHEVEARLALDAVWNAERQKTLQRQLAESHCGHIDDQRAEQLSRAQRARDAVMADILLTAGEGGAVAILGRGHARLDLAVPLYLARRDARRTVASVGIVEVESGKREPGSYVAGEPAHDYLWFTPKAARPDPCAIFRKKNPQSLFQ